ncbi:MurR/RpiR family transcriptional regulator [Clostridium sp. D2Q-14]|uniref:MurR/RpiR family transcriptional regulator n=1 Tax=Anaeromonas gelatinilytica TaxID=2683194 RepID=UPI00193AFCDC|nr:MurR/RpiR family transcriptional regulator [Anaeromonas gelatinilytica]MBS4535266.1 MurR/RpiR family transcriptional regulator [Anaeromonas gelatinilytica]
MNVILRIKEGKQDLTQSEMKLSKYILENLNDISELSVQSLAEKSDTSPATIIRFCKKIGCNGFQDFKINLVKDVSQKNNISTRVYEDITTKDTIKEVMEKLSYENIKIIEDTIKLLDENEIEKTIDCIEKSDKIFLYGVGASGLVAKDFQYKLARIKKTANFYLDSHTQLALSANMGKDDVAIGISYSGRTLETYKAIEKAKERGATTISITKYGKNPLSDIADIKIYVAAGEQNIRVGAITSRIAQLTAIDVIFVGIAKKDFEKTSEYIKNTRKIVEDFKINK